MQSYKLVKEAQGERTKATSLCPAVGTAFWFEAKAQHRPSQARENVGFEASWLFVLVYQADISPLLFS